MYERATVKVQFMRHQTKPIISYHSHRNITRLAFHIKLKINQIVLPRMTWLPGVPQYGHGGIPPRPACIVLFSCNSIVLEAILPDLVPFQCRFTTIMGKGSRTRWGLCEISEQEINNAWSKTRVVARVREKSFVRIAKIRPFQVQAPLGSRSYHHLWTRCYYFAYTVKKTYRRAFSLYFVNKLFLFQDFVFIW